MMDATKRFSNRVADYVLYRPRYPAGLIELLAKEIGLERSWSITDVGSGTGISAEPFLKLGNVVFGVEPNDEMRQAAESLLKGFSNFRSTKGTAEATGLASGSMNAIVAGQAFHWFDAARSSEEFRRILKPGGWVVLIWNRRQIDTTPFLRDYEALLNEHGIDYGKVRHENIDESKLSAFFTRGYECKVLPNEQIFDLNGLRGRLLSSSYVPAEGQPGFDPMIAGLRRIFEKHNEAGRVRFKYDTDIYYGRL